MYLQLGHVLHVPLRDVPSSLQKVQLSLQVRDGLLSLDTITQEALPEEDFLWMDPNPQHLGGKHRGGPSVSLLPWSLI